MPVLTVTGLNNYVKALFDENEYLNDITLRAEISNYKNHSSGHRYMTLKDENSSIAAVMFAGNASRLRFPVENGMKVIVRGRAAIYTKSGQYQFYIQDMMPDGIGEQSLAFEALKKKLYKEGLFSPEHKKPLPELPKRIGVITSDTGAAVEDIRKVLLRRYPIGEIIIAPVLVQGVNAAPELTAAVKKFDRLKCADVIIIGRGGGTSEDLWAFNDEGLARAIYECEIPVVSGVGHEIDTTICDFVADAAASTPSAAAEIISPGEGELLGDIEYYHRKIISALRTRLNLERKNLEGIARSKVLRDPHEITEEKRRNIEMISAQLRATYKGIVTVKEKEFSSLAAKLDALSPLKVLSRGYAVATKDGSVISSVHSVEINDKINVMLSDGSVDCIITERTGK